MAVAAELVVDAVAEAASPETLSVTDPAVSIAPEDIVAVAVIEDSEYE